MLRQDVEQPDVPHANGTDERDLENGYRALKGELESLLDYPTPRPPNDGIELDANAQRSVVPRGGIEGGGTVEQGESHLRKGPERLACRGELHPTLPKEDPLGRSECRVPPVEVVSADETERDIPANAPLGDAKLGGE